MFHTYRVKPIHSELKDVYDCYVVQRKIFFIWWTLKYFNTYREAELWIDKNVFGE